MQDIIKYLEKQGEVKFSNQIKALVKEKEDLEKEKGKLVDFISFVNAELKKRYSRDRIISNLVLEAKKRKLFF